LAVCEFIPKFGVFESLNLSLSLGSLSVYSYVWTVWEFRLQFVLFESMLKFGLYGSLGLSLGRLGVHAVV
jgi:hypothetical protein